MTSAEDKVKSIQDAYLSGVAVPRDTVDAWMRDQDLRVPGAVVFYLLDMSGFHSGRVAPPLTQTEKEDFRSCFHERCLREDPPRAQWVSSREESAKEILDWFWDTQRYEEDESTASRLKNWLGRIYLDSDAEVRTAIVHFILDRLFEYRYWREFFSDWHDQAHVRDAYKQAAEVGMSRSGEDEMAGIEAANEASEPIPQVIVKCWMASTNIDVLGCLWQHVLTDEVVFNQIEPPLSQADLGQFYRYYYARCIKEDPHAKWGASRYAAADDVHRWFETASDEHLETLVCVRDWLAAMYLEGDEDVRDAIVCGALEHILEQPRWRGFFKDWCEDPVLREAYDRAMEWSVEHEE